MVGLNNKTAQVHYSEFHAFCKHQVYIYFIYAPFLQNIYGGCFWRLTLTGMTERRKSFVLKLYKYKFAQNAFCTFYVFFYMIPPHSKVSILMLFRGLLVY